MESTLTASDPHNGHAYKTAFSIFLTPANTLQHKWGPNQVSSIKKETVHTLIV